MPLEKTDDTASCWSLEKRLKLDSIFFVSSASKETTLVRHMIPQTQRLNPEITEDSTLGLKTGKAPYLF